MVFLNIDNKINFSKFINYMRINSIIFIVGLPFLSLYFDTKIILFIFFINFIFELFYGSKVTNYFFLLMSILYSRFFMYPLEPEGEVLFYINQFSGNGNFSLISQLAPITFWFLKGINYYFTDNVSTIYIFRIFIALTLFILLYSLLEKITNNRRLLFVIVFSFMFWHTQIVGFEQDQFKNFFAQIFFLLFLKASINNSKIRYFYFITIILTHLSYAIIAFIILLFQKKIYNNKIDYIRFSLFVVGIFVLLLFIIPLLHISFLSISQRVGDYIVYSQILFENQLQAKGGYLFTEILSTNAISVYFMIFLLVRYRYLLQNTTFRYLFLSFLIPYLISKMYLIQLPFLVDRFIMLYHGFWIITFYILSNNLIVKGSYFKPFRFLFGFYLFLVTFVILIKEQKGQFYRLLNSDFEIFANHYGVLFTSYIVVFIIFFVKYHFYKKRSLL